MHNARVSSIDNESPMSLYELTGQCVLYCITERATADETLSTGGAGEINFKENSHDSRVLSLPLSFSLSLALSPPCDDFIFVRAAGDIFLLSRFFSFFFFFFFWGSPSQSD